MANPSVELASTDKRPGEDLVWGAQEAESGDDFWDDKKSV